MVLTAVRENIKTVMAALGTSNQPAFKEAQGNITLLIVVIVGKFANCDCYPSHFDKHNLHVSLLKCTGIYRGKFI